ncbi:hypothetical protein J6590_097352 [Homalodisca vitripennis]|nr:hypothetical protein J6590_097352 [Homalodisca vitripennis]
MEAERVFLACTDYAPVPAGLFESLSTQSKVLSSLVVKVLEFGIKIIYTNGSYARHYF